MNEFITLDEYTHKSENLKLMAEDTEYYPISYIRPGSIYEQSANFRKTHFISPIKDMRNLRLSINTMKGIKNRARTKTGIKN